jgi:adenylosuccinate lyase
MRRVILITLIFGFLNAHALNSDSARTVIKIFEENNKNQLVLDFEAALASAQAAQGIIPTWAAEEISSKADVKYAPLIEIREEYEVVNHRMVALLNVWSRSIKNGAHEYVHFGATTVDIYDTVLILQLNEASTVILNYLLNVEATLMTLAMKHRDTVMAGRTRGQHALPITFGKKVSTWLGENRRNIDRLKEVQSRLAKSGILKGAVGTHLGLGKKGKNTELLMMKELKLSKPFSDDWHPARDVLAEYASVLALVSKSFGRIGNELFLLQMTDIGETEEILSKSSVSSSTMPHKKNPSKPEALIFYSRVIPSMAEVIMDDMINSFERDDTSRTAKVLASISLETEQMLLQANLLLKKLKINDQVMLDNLERTNGLIMSQRIAFELADKIGKATANNLMRKIVKKASQENIPLKEAITRSPEISKYFSNEQLDNLLDPSTYIGLSAEQTESVVKEISEKRKLEDAILD